MMSTLRVLLFLGLLTVAFGALHHKEAVTLPSQPGKCWVAEHKTFYAPESSWQELKGCASSTCIENSGSLYVTTATCGKVVGCNTAEDSSLPYPDCCPRCV